MDGSDTDNIILENVTVKFNRKVVLDNISFNVKKGEFISIIGPNGSGKTTLLKTILGLIKPVKGSVKIFNYYVGEYPSGLIGYLPQHISYNERFPIKVIDVVLMGRYPLIGYLKFPSKNDMKIVLNCLDELNILEYADYNFQELSGGLKQRVLIARALAIEPEVLILDEPSTSLDIMIQRDFYSLLKKLQKDKVLTIIMVSHDIGVVTQYVDKILCLNKKIHYYDKVDKHIPDSVVENVFGDKVMFIVHDKNCLTCLRENGRNNNQ
jgi:zinc transport system ATP-binding protein